MKKKYYASLFVIITLFVNPAISQVYKFKVVQKSLSSASSAVTMKSSTLDSITLRFKREENKECKIICEKVSNSNSQTYGKRQLRLADSLTKPKLKYDSAVVKDLKTQAGFDDYVNFMSEMSEPYLYIFPFHFLPEQVFTHDTTLNFQTNYKTEKYSLQNSVMYYYDVKNIDTATYNNVPCRRVSWSIQNMIYNEFLSCINWDKKFQALLNVSGVSYYSFADNSLIHSYASSEENTNTSSGTSISTNREYSIEQIMD